MNSAHSEEFRVRRLGELRCYFPDTMTHVQCRYCVEDGVCWHGPRQGFQCAAFFMKHSPNPLMVARKMHYEYPTKEDIEIADFPHLLLIAGLRNINILLISRMTAHALRSLVYKSLFRENNVSN